MDGGAKTQLTIEAFANKRTKEDDLDDAVATFFSSAIAFNAARNEAFKAMVRMINEAAPGYKPP